MTKRALKRQLREGAFDASQFEGDDKIRRLPIDRADLPRMSSSTSGLIFCGMIELPVQKPSGRRRKLNSCVL